MTAYIISELDADNTIDVLGILFDRVSAIGAYNNIASCGYQVELVEIDLDEYTVADCIDGVTSCNQKVLLTNIDA